MNRRRFLIGSALAAAGGGLLVGWAARPPDLLGDRLLFNVVPGETALNGWVRIAADGTATVAVPRADLGQGIGSALAALVAEELDLPWEQVRQEMPPQGAVYANATMVVDGMALLPAEGDGWWPRFARQLAANGVRHLAIVGTGGSASVRDGWLPMRTAGAAARQMLVAAAARKWQVDADACTTAHGRVLHAASGRSAGYGELAPLAARVGLQGSPRLRDPAQWRLIGKGVRRLDVPAKVAGTLQFGIDTILPGLLHAAVRMAPHPGGEVTRLAPDAVLAEPGIEAVVRVPGGVAVVAGGWWQAQEAAARLEVAFSRPDGRLDDAALVERYRALAADGQAHVHQSHGDQAQARGADGGPGGRVLQRDYLLPFQAHATAEPMNCTARVADGRCDVWMGHQAPTLLRRAAAEAAGVPEERVVFHAAPLGGGLGRRFEVDLVVQAVTVATHVPGRPVKLVWSRTEDLRHDFHRPSALVRLRAALDAGGGLAAWHARVVTPSVVQAMLARQAPWAAFDAMPDKTAVDGAIDLPYAVAALRVEHVPAPAGLPVGIWRSVGHSINAFAVEAMVDELALAARQDPVHFRAGLLAGSPRHLAVLRAAAAAAGWDRTLPPGQGRGVALHACFGSVVAAVVEVAPDAGAWRVSRIVAAVDCGTVIDPDTVRGQVEGGLLFGLAAAAHSRIHLDDGQVRESNFDTFACLRMADTPPVQVVLLDGAQGPPGGVGEIGVPPLAPALASALFAATGRRRYALPLDLSAGGQA